MNESGERLFEQAQGAIEEALRYVAYRRRLAPAEFQELRSFVFLKLIENDYARLRKQSEEGAMSAYLHVVVQRLYLDHQIRRWGKWHASSEARRRGDDAVLLERLIYRDGHTIQEAVELMSSMSRVRSSADELYRLAYALPVRHRPRFVPDDQLVAVGSGVAEDPVERRENESRAAELQSELARAMLELDGEDRRLLRMRFGDRRSIPEIASSLGVDAKPLYARIRRLLARIRRTLERQGFVAKAGSYLTVAARAIDLDEVFAHATA